MRSLGQIQGNLAVIGAGIILQKSAPPFSDFLLVGRNLIAVGPLVDFPVVHPGALQRYVIRAGKRRASVDLYSDLQIKQSVLCRTVIKAHPVQRIPRRFNRPVGIGSGGKQHTIPSFLPGYRAAVKKGLFRRQSNRPVGERRIGILIQIGEKASCLSNRRAFRTLRPGFGGFGFLRCRRSRSGNRQ